MSRDGASPDPQRMSGGMERAAGEPGPRRDEGVADRRGAAVEAIDARVTVMVLEHVAGRIPCFRGRLELVGVIPLGEDLSSTPIHPIDRLRDANRQTLH